MMSHSIAKFLVTLLIAGTAFAETPQSLFQRGIESFRREDWPGAIRAWRGIELQGLASGQLFYDLGNAYYRAGDVGKAILYYERARTLLPRDRDVRQNLGLARMAAVDRIESPVRLVVWDWVDRVRDCLSLYELSRLVIVLELLTVALGAYWIFGPVFLRGKLRTAVIGLAALYVFSIGWYGWRSALNSHERAIVMDTKVDVFSAPDSAATQIFTLHEGTELNLFERIAGWTHVSLLDGRSGWLPSETIEKI
jgi:tetratricopeptide (TPR) repeat protein